MNLEYCNAVILYIKMKIENDLKLIAFIEQ